MATNNAYMSGTSYTAAYYYSTRPIFNDGSTGNSIPLEEGAYVPQIQALKYWTLSLGGTVEARTVSVSLTAVSSMGIPTLPKYTTIRPLIQMSTTSASGTLSAFPIFSDFANPVSGQAARQKAPFDFYILVSDEIDSSNKYNIYLRINYADAIQNNGVLHFYGERPVPNSLDTYTYHLSLTASSKAYTLTRQVKSAENAVEDAVVYSSAAAQTSLGTFTVYSNSFTNELFIKLPAENIDFSVLDQGSSAITVSNKSIVDYKTNTDPIIKLKVANNGTNYYLAGGLYESAKITLGFTKPSTAVSAIELKVITNNYALSPNILFAGAALVNSIPTQYNGINRSSITDIDTSSGSFFKVSGSQITFGADTDVSLSFCLDTELVKGIDVTAA